MKYAVSELFSDEVGPDGKDVIIPVPSKSNPNKTYNINVTNGSCSCPAWINKSIKVPCKHLIELGFVKMDESLAHNFTGLDKSTKEVAAQITQMKGNFLNFSDAMKKLKMVESSTFKSGSVGPNTQTIPKKYFTGTAPHLTLGGGMVKMPKDEVQKLNKDPKTQKAVVHIGEDGKQEVKVLEMPESLIQYIQEMGTS